jgi:hypothetical protein
MPALLGRIDSEGSDCVYHSLVHEATVEPKI